MNLTTRTALAQLLAAAGATLNAFAAELGATPFTSAEPEAQPETPAVKTRKPREPKAEKPVEPEPEEQKAAVTKTYDDMKAVIEPLVKEGRGAEVKATIAKYSPTLKEMDPAHYAAFEKDIEALSY